MSDLSTQGQAPKYEFQDYISYANQDSIRVGVISSSEVSKMLIHKFIEEFQNAYSEAMKRIMTKSGVGREWRTKQWARKEIGKPTPR
ncbi:unnamed protein product [Camellia sinensis]